MQDAADFSVRTQEQRWLMSGALMARFVFVIAGSALLFVLHWPYPTWLKVVAVAVFVIEGIVAARALRRSTNDEQVRAVSRRLLVIDTVVTAGLVYLFMPLYHDVWAFFLLLVIFGATQDRQAAPIFSALVSIGVILVSYFWPASAPASAPSVFDLIIDILVIAMMAAGVDVVFRALVARSASLAARTDALFEIADTQTTRVAASEAQTERMHKVIDLAVTLMRERELGPLLDRILEATTSTFGFRCGAIMTAERDRQVYAYRSVLGYAPEQMRHLMIREVPFAQAKIKLDQRFQVRPSTYYAPVERQSWHTDPLTCYRPESALLP